MRRRKHVAAEELLFGIEPQGLKALVFVRDSTVRLQAAPFQNS